MPILLAELVKLFWSLFHGKAIEPSLSATSVKNLIKNAAMNAGLDSEDVDDFSGHSFRAGAAQELLCAGFDTAAFMHAGG